MTGIAKAWVNFDGSTSTASIKSSFNVSSVTNAGSGLWNITFTTAMSSANFVITGSANQSSTGFSGGQRVVNGYCASSSQASLQITYQNGGVATDPQIICVAIFAS
jgi:hypothetical protein